MGNVGTIVDLLSQMTGKVSHYMLVSTKTIALDKSHSIKLATTTWRISVEEMQNCAFKHRGSYADTRTNCFLTMYLGLYGQGRAGRLYASQSANNFPRQEHTWDYLLAVPGSSTELKN